jgi:hypothetical protein
MDPRASPPSRPPPLFSPSLTARLALSRQGPTHIAGGALLHAHALTHTVLHVPGRRRDIKALRRHIWMLMHDEVSLLPLSLRWTCRTELFSLLIYPLLSYTLSPSTLPRPYSLAHAPRTFLLDHDPSLLRSSIVAFASAT